MKSYRTISHARCLYETDRDLRSDIRPLMMMTDMILETSVSYRHLTWLIAQEDFIEFSHRESSTSYILGK